MTDLPSKALSAVKSYLTAEYDAFSLKIITKELNGIAKIDFSTVNTAQKNYSYDSLQEELATLNEKCATRKLKGVYYTPADIVEFILTNSIKFFYDELETDCLNKSLPKNLPHEKFCYECTFFDPTCGSGVFLLAVLELKLKLLEKNSDNVRRVVATVFGNDVNADSVLIAKLRLFLCVLKICGAEYVAGLADIFNQNFSQCDFVNDSDRCSAQKYDVILGNPPYVEDSKAPASPPERYSNIYANVLSNAAQILKDNGVIGFIIPLSYMSTPRMKKFAKNYFNACRNNTFSALPTDPIAFLFPYIKSCAFYLPEIRAITRNCSRVIIVIGIKRSAKNFLTV